MNETTIIPIMVLAFSGIVILSLYLERLLDRKKKELILKKKLSLQLKYNSRYFHEEQEEAIDIAKKDHERNPQFEIPSYYEKESNKNKVSATSLKKLTALDEVNV